MLWGLFFILCFGGIYFYAFICPKLPINGSGYHFYDDSHVVEYNVELVILSEDFLKYMSFIENNVLNKDSSSSLDGL